MSRGRGSQWLGALVAVVLAWIVVYPLFLVFVEGIHTPGGWTLEAVGRFVRERNEWGALWASCWISLASVALSALIGIPLAFLVARYHFPGRRVISGILALPAVLPPLVGVIAFLFLYGETGFAAHLFQYVFHLEEAPWRLQGPGAVLLVHAYSMYVYFYLFTRAGLQRLDPSLLEAAATLGAGRWRMLRRVVLPLLWPALGGAGLLTFLTSLASFSAPYIFGGGFRVMTTQIVSTRLNGDIPLAMVETFALTVVALLGLALLRHSSRNGDRSGGSKGVAPEPRRLRTGISRFLVPTAVWCLAVFLILPHLTLLLVSFVPRGTWTLEAVPPVYSVGNYFTLFQDPVRLRPMVTSLWMATAATVFAVATALVVAILVLRRRVRVAALLETLLEVPWAVPGTVFAIALATMFSVNAPLAGRVILVGTLVILPLAYFVRSLPITGRAILAGFRQLDPSLEEAAATLGASRWRTLRRVTLPLLRPAIAAGASLAFATAFGDFLTSVILYTYDTRPISLEILGSLRQSDVGVAAAYGVMLMLISGIVFALAGERAGGGVA